MRMRKRPNLAPRMENCAHLLIDSPESLRGRWLESFPGYSELHLELGCGKGRFTVDTAQAEPDILFVAVEKVADAMVIAMERVKERGLNNVRFICCDGASLPELFGEGELKRIYINFCDPWPKSRDAKLRLTSPGFLRLYADALGEDGQIHFKTDNAPLFAWSMEQFTAEGWALSQLSRDLHKNGILGCMTDYEAKFHALGIKINRLVAQKTASTLGTAAGPVARLRSAALSDARGSIETAKTQDGENKG